jgi:hypothetical protein
MVDTQGPRPRVSVADVNSKVEGGVNDKCHNYTGGVKAHQKHIMRNPRVVVILWGHYYRTNPNAGAFAVKLISDLVTGPFMNGLVQYGIGRGSFAGQIVIDTDQNNPAPASLDETQVQDQLMKWIQASTVLPAPSVNETNLLYFIFPPTTTQLKLKDGTTGFCGYHQHGKSNNTSANDDLFWAIVKTDSADQTTEEMFVKSISACASHELAEAFSDRDIQGFIADNSCEIGDICETKTFFQYRGWTVEQYWSNWDNNCIQGDQPVSLRKFLGAIGFDVNQGLQSLNTPVINLQYMASRM